MSGSKVPLGYPELMNCSSWNEPLGLELTFSLSLDNDHTGHIVRIRTRFTSLQQSIQEQIQQQDEPWGRIQERPEGWIEEEFEEVMTMLAED